MKNHLPDIEWSLIQLKMSRSSTNRLPWVELQMNGISEEGIFTAWLMFHHQYCFMSAIILLVDQWLNACAVVRSENFRISSSIGLSLDPNQSFLFLSNQKLIEFPVSFPFWGPALGLLQPVFLNFHFENSPLDDDRDLATVVLFNGSIPYESAR